MNAINISKHSLIFGSVLSTILIFTALPAESHVLLDYPTGGEIFSHGEVITMKWHILIDHEQLDWDLYFSSDGGTHWQTIAENLPVEQPEFDYALPDTLTANARVRIVQDNVAADYQAENGDFTISDVISGIDQVNLGISPVEDFECFTGSFNGLTTFGSMLIHEEHVSPEIFDLSGRMIESVINTRLIPGK